MQFTGNTNVRNTVCPLPNIFFHAAIQPYQGNLRTDGQPDCSTFAGGCGIFTRSRARRLPGLLREWRAAYVDGPGTANFEVALYENNSSSFDALYGLTADLGSGK